MTADGIEVRIEGLRELDVKLGEFGPRLGPAVLSLALVRAAAPTVQLMKALVPYGRARRTKKGRVRRHLRDSITATTRLKAGQRAFSDPATAHAFIGPAGKGSGHALLVERGHVLIRGKRAKGHLQSRIDGQGKKRWYRTVVADTRRPIGVAPPRPYMAPAWAATQQDVLRLFTAEVWDICVATAAGAASAAASGRLNGKAAASIGAA